VGCTQRELCTKPTLHVVQLCGHAWAGSDRLYWACPCFTYNLPHHSKAEPPQQGCPACWQQTLCLLTRFTLKSLTRMPISGTWLAHRVSVVELFAALHFYLLVQYVFRVCGKAICYETSTFKCMIPSHDSRLIIGMANIMDVLWGIQLHVKRLQWTDLLHNRIAF